jgi:hypothetical protein
MTMQDTAIGKSKQITIAKMIPVADRELKNRPSFREAIKRIIAMVHRSMRLIRRTLEQLFDVTVMPVVFTLLFTFLFGGAVSGSWQNYLPIIIPGILAQTVITATRQPASNYARIWTMVCSTDSNPCLSPASLH